jgi:glutamate/tyrosine decarboxylase-like PLP-dependent enzyme
MNHTLQHDLSQIESILSAAKDFGLEHLNTLNNIATSKEKPELRLSDLPVQGFGAEKVQALFKEEFYPNIIATAGSRYWGFVTGGTTPAAIAGDWLTTVFDQNTQTIKGGDLSASLEQHTIKLLLQLFNLPIDDFLGGMVTGATMSNFTGLAVARQWLGKQLRIDVAKDGVPAGMKVYAATPHSSAIKSLSMLGIGSSNIQLLPALPDRECLDTEALKNVLEKNGDTPFILIASAGTVNTVDYDDLKLIASLKKQYSFWFHIDAAFGAFAACSTNYKHLLQGWEAADSITVDCHKWLNAPYDSAVIFTRKEHVSLQVQTFQNSNAPYLGDPMQQFNYLNFVPENSRRFRALPVWFSLMAYGKEGYRDIVDNNISLAQELGKRITASGNYELAAPVRLNTVCFTVKGEAKGDKIQHIVKFLRRRGRLFITPTIYKGQTCLRAALVNWRTGMEDIDIAIEELTLAHEEIAQHSEPNIQHN